MTREQLLDAVLQAYELGAAACSKVNFGRKGWTKSDAKRERGSLNQLFKKLEFAPLTDLEHALFD